MNDWTSKPQWATLVGEDNPYGKNPRYALWLAPEGSAGHRLCKKILDMRNPEYVREFRRINLCSGKWSIKEARATAESLLDGSPLILLGSKVCRAFGFDYQPFTSWLLAPLHLTSERRSPHLILPHPSGRCRLWNEPGSYERARKEVTQFRLDVEKTKTGVPS